MGCVDLRDLDPDPIRAFAAWFAAAVSAGVAQPEGMALATATPDGRPSVRMVLLKGHDARGFTFFTNRESRKGDELAANPRAALVLHWQPLHRQVRIEGAVERIADAESETYFATRAPGSQIAAWASPQSRPIAGREELDRIDSCRLRFGGSSTPDHAPAALGSATRCEQLLEVAPITAADFAESQFGCVHSDYCSA